MPGNGTLVISNLYLMEEKQESKKVAGSNPGWGDFWVDFAYSLCECVVSGYSGFFPTDQKNAC